tara:strand:- start:1209 stop:1433 length:225 start_codon:yes stop_codon:yes gene_type:complete
MSSMFGSTKYRESEADKQLRLDIKKRKDEEEAERIAIEKEEKRQKKRKDKGLVGSRSMFSRAGGKGFYYEGDEI